MADLITVEEAKQQLNIQSGVHDPELAAYVSATTAAVEHHVGPVLARDVTEVHRSGPVLALDQAPALSLTSVTPVLSGGTGHPITDLDLDPPTGIVRRLDGGWFVGPLRVEYQAGRADVPPHIGLAARIILQHLWSTQRGMRGAPRIGGMADTLGVPGSGYAIPNAALELLGPALPGIA